MTNKSLIKFFFVGLGIFVVSGRAFSQSESPTEPSGHALKIRDVDFKGLLRTEGLLYLKPSGLAGQSRFQIPYANVEALIRTDMDVEIDLEAVYRSPVAAGQSEFSLPRLNARIPVSEHSRLTVGLFESASLEGQLSFWPWDNAHRDLAFPGVRWGYLPLSDYGVEWVYQGEAWRTGLSVTNGEGYQVRDQGPQKDFALWYSQRWGAVGDRQTELMLRLVHGGYENVPDAQARKQRYQASLISWSESGVFGGVESIWAQDPVDAINKLIADAVDLTDLGGQRVNAQIFSLTFGYSWGWREGQRWLLFGRSDSVQPVVGETERGIESNQLALSYAPSRGQEWIFHLSSLNYGERHAQSTRDEQIWRISYNVSWD